MKKHIIDVNYYFFKTFIYNNKEIYFQVRKTYSDYFLKLNIIKKYWSLIL